MDSAHRSQKIDDLVLTAEGRFLNHHNFDVTEWFEPHELILYRTLHFDVDLICITCFKDEKICKCERAEL